MSTSLVRVMLPFLLALVTLGHVAVAKAEPDPPARVGRASLVEGDVAYLRDGEWAPLPLNWPITAGARLSTAPGARTEVRIGSTAVRMASTTELEFVHLDDEAIEIRLLQGTIDTRVRSREVAQSFTVETPESRTTLRDPGRYRFDAGVVRRADAQPDAFDEWTLARDRRDDASRSARYVSPEMTGHESLDDHGDWREVTEYGPVWVPRAVPAGWAPYRSGRWAWVAPWGWTWIDEAPWGFAPFHYGRWALIGGVWAWAPGRIVARPVFAPALVGWVGRPGWSVTVSVGAVSAVGWFPLAPREVFVPAYRHSVAYARHANVAHVTNVTHITNVTRVTNVNYAHRHVERAVTVVPAAAVTSGQPVGRSHVQVRRADLVREASASNVPPVAAVVPAPRPAPPEARRDDDRRFERREPDMQREPADRRSEQRRVDARPSAPAVPSAPSAPATASAPTQSASPAPVAPQPVAPATRVTESTIDRAPPRMQQPPIAREPERAPAPAPTPPIQAVPASPRSHDGPRAVTADGPNPRVEDRSPLRNTERTKETSPRVIEQRAEPARAPQTEQRRELRRIESPQIQRVEPPRAIAPVAPTPAAMQPQARPLPQPSPPSVVPTAPPVQQQPPPTARPAQPQPQIARPAPPPPQQAQQPPQSGPRGGQDRGPAREQRRGEGRGPG